MTTVGVGLAVPYSGPPEAYTAGLPEFPSTGCPWYSVVKEGSGLVP